MQTVRNRVADILGIDLPIVQAPMNYIAGHALAAAVSAAGGMGVLGPNAGKVQGEEISMRERTLREFARIREVTDKPVGINVVVPDGENKAALMYARSTVEAAAEGGATAAFCVGGLQPTIFELIKEKGMKLIVRPLTPTVKNAREAQAMGADIFVATGYDAGGFLPSHHTGTFSIVPMIVDAVTIPVLAAGGINDLRGVRAAFALGAEGVYVGTRFIATNECAANDHAKELICKLSGSNLLYVDETQRSLPTEFAAEAYVKHRLAPRVIWDRHCQTRILAPTVPTTVDLVGALRTGMYDGEPDKGIVTVNTGIDVIRSVVPAAQVVSELMADFLRYADFLKAKASAEEATPKA
jgi:enoyl-[acyl-carrier protein] reductase II